MPRHSLTTALAVTVVAFVVYRTTMLPGVELGDSASFQVMVGAPHITPRDAYPLYFAIADLVFWATGAQPARAANLASVIEGALACGVAAMVATSIAGSALAGGAAALMLAGSYTFWSQSVIAEVYALHVLLIASTLLLLLRWAERPTLLRLSVFLIVYALSFGNHLGMILCAPALALYLFLAAPGGWRALVTPRIVALALGSAVLGASQYAWNWSALWFQPSPPATLAEAFGTFWFDVTKADWRDSMVLRVPASMTSERLQMYAFDLSQQFGWPAVVLAGAGTIALLRSNPRQAVLLVLALVTNLLFALTYNVGDSHVFFLPTHLIVALMTAPGIVALGGIVASRPAIAVVAVTLVGARMYRDYPALNRSGDAKPAELLDSLTSELDDREAVLVSDLNWQIQNGLHYYVRYDRPQIAHASLPEIISHLPAFASDNRAIGRDVVLTDRARVASAAEYGSAMASRLDDRIHRPTIVDIVRALPAGTRYVICFLRPTREFQTDLPALEESLRRLTGNHLTSFEGRDYAAMAGFAGRTPALVRISDRPFREVVFMDGLRVEVRMESWLTFDTVRRMGFGHVIAGRNHALIVERGVSFVALGRAGEAVATGFEANIFEPQPRYLVTFLPPGT